MRSWRGDFGKGVNRSQLSSLLLSRISGLNNAVVKELYRTSQVTPVGDLIFSHQDIVDYDKFINYDQLIWGYIRHE